MTVRWVIVHMMELPDTSRIKRHYGGDQALFDIKDHLICDVRDLLLMGNYFSAIVAMKDLKETQRQKVLRGVPSRPRRPGEEEKKPRFATPEELQSLFPQKAALKRRKRLQQKRMQQQRLGR